MTIKIEEFDLMARLNQVAEEFQALLTTKDERISELEEMYKQSQIQNSHDDAQQSVIDGLNARLEKAKEFFKAQQAEIKQLKEENEQLQAQLEVKLPF
jgi:superoxide dismutase